MDFVVIGGSAFSVYTDTRAEDLDIAVYDYGTLNEKELDKVVAKTKDGKILKFRQFGVDVDLLTPGQQYKKDGKVLFKVPNRFKKVKHIEGIKVVDVPILMNMLKDRDRVRRYEMLIKIFNLSKDFDKNLFKKLRNDYNLAYSLAKKNY